MAESYSPSSWTIRLLRTLCQVAIIFSTGDRQHSRNYFKSNCTLGFDFLCKCLHLPAHLFCLGFFKCPSRFKVQVFLCDNYILFHLVFLLISCKKHACFPNHSNQRIPSCYLVYNLYDWKEIKPRNPFSRRESKSLKVVHKNDASSESLRHLSSFVSRCLCFRA